MVVERLSHKERSRIRGLYRLGIVAPIAVIAALVFSGVLSFGLGVVILLTGAPAFFLLRRYIRPALADGPRIQAPTTAGTQVPDYADAIMRAVPDPLILVDARHHAVAANEAAQALFNTRLVGRDMVQVLRNPSAIEALEKSLQGGGPAEAEISFLAHADRQFLLRVIPVTRSGDEDTPPDVLRSAPPFRGALITLHEITALKQSERLRSDFVANASHELRTPLASIVGFIETLSGPARDDPEARERFLAIMDQEASRMARLVEDLLSLSRIEQDEHLLPEGAVDLAGIVGRVVKALELRASEKKMSIETSFDEPVPQVIGDDDQLTQVFQNLIDNAIKYGRDDSSVRISARPVERLPETGKAGLALSVFNDGEGIEREHIPRLTDRFYRVDAARSRELGGTGLGLAIVKHIVNRHRGTLSVESERGVGTTVTVSLPILSQEHADTS